MDGSTWQTSESHLWTQCGVSVDSRPSPGKTRKRNLKMAKRQNDISLSCVPLLQCKPSVVVSSSYRQSPSDRLAAAPGESVQKLELWILLTILEILVLVGVLVLKFWVLCSTAAASSNYAPKGLLRLPGQ